MKFLLDAGTRIVYGGESSAVKNAAVILYRDLTKKCASRTGSEIVLSEDNTIDSENYIIEAAEKMTIYASCELGFVYGLLYISEKFLGIQPFWFWMDQQIEKTDCIAVPYGRYTGEKAAVKYRGWFVNDEVLIMKWSIDNDPSEPWRMVFESLLRCGGNLVIPGTDKNSRKYRKTASDMGLWITHHHAEPLGAEMFTRIYPDKAPNYTEYSDLFIKLWEDSIKEQKNSKTVWCLGFRGQGDSPFWNSDTTGQFDTDEKRGRLISDIIELQRQLVLKYVDKPVFCTNLYGEIMELYEAGHITLSDDIIKISADNGYGKMVTRRRDNHTVRIPSMPLEKQNHGGIYYHASFYDLQAANHITMLPNSVDFVNSELSEVSEKGMNDYWLINCSNVRPHTYFLDAIRKKWYGHEISDETHSREFTETYFGKNNDIAGLYCDYHKAMLSFGENEDEHAGEQFYTENVRILIHAVFNGRENTPGLRWITGTYPLAEQSKAYAGMVRSNLGNIEAFYNNCQKVSSTLGGEVKKLFDATIFLHAAIHYYCSLGVVSFGDGYEKYTQGDFKGAFMEFGRCAEMFYRANSAMRENEYDVWKGFYFNECFADVKHTAYMAKKIMGLARERGDNARHDKWYRDIMYAPEDRKIMTLLVNDNHMEDWDLYEAMKKGEKNEA